MKSLWRNLTRESSAGGHFGSARPELSASAEEAIYVSMVAGSFPKPKSDSSKSAYWIAREALNDDRLAMVSGHDDTHVFYLAVPTRAFSNGSLELLPLAAALPNHPEHEGDGAYVLHIKNSDVTVAVLKDGKNFKIICNETMAVQETIEDSKLRQIECSSKVPWPLQSLRMAAEEAADVATKWAGRVSAVVLAMSVITYLVSLVMSPLMESRFKDAISSREHSLASMIGQISLSSPLAEQMAKFQNITSVVVRAGGWIKSYSFKQGVETFVVELPEWVSRDYLDALGSEITTEFDKVNSVLVVSKGVHKVEK